MFYIKSGVVINEFFLWLKNTGNNLMCEEVGKLWFYRLVMLFILSILITLALFGASLMAKYCNVNISSKLMTKSTPVPLMPAEQATLFTRTKGKKFKKNHNQSKAANSSKNQEKLLLEQNEENKEEFAFEDDQDSTIPMEQEKSVIVEKKTRTVFKNKCYKMKKNFSKILKSRKIKKQRAMSEENAAAAPQLLEDENLSNLNLNEENGTDFLPKKFHGKKGKLVKMNAIMMKSTLDLAALFKNSDE